MNQLAKYNTIPLAQRWIDMSATAPVNGKQEI
jgi:hypothetical protein